jgi:poly(hydroxyalkanoate) depolymerase family esterase
MPHLRIGQAMPAGGSKLVEYPNFGANPGALRMFLYAPKALPKKAPLVVILHGCTQDAAAYDAGSGWSQLADCAGFVVLAPEQTRENNVNGCFNWFQPGDTAHGEGEAASIRQMIEYAVTTYDLDRKRIFITGLSAGGAMTAAMLGAYPEVFAGGAVIAGLPIDSAANIPEALGSMRHAPDRSAADWGARARNKSRHGGPWSRLSVWHGDADATVHLSNAEALVAQWTNLHGADGAPASDRSEAGYRHRVWQDEAGNAVVEAVTVSGMGHGAPLDCRDDGIGQTGPYFLDAGLSSTRRIAGFWGLPIHAEAAFAGRKAGDAKSRLKGKLPDIVRSVLEKAGMLRRNASTAESHAKGSVQMPRG